MAKRKGRTIGQAEAERGQNERRWQDYIKELQREEQRRDQDAAMEAAQKVIDEYRERRPPASYRRTGARPYSAG